MPRPCPAGQTTDSFFPRIRIESGQRAESRQKKSGQADTRQNPDRIWTVDIHRKTVYWNGCAQDFPDKTRQGQDTDCCPPTSAQNKRGSCRSGFSRLVSDKIILNCPGLSKVECVFPMVVSMLAQAEFGQNDYREVALHFMIQSRREQPPKRSRTKIADQSKKPWVKRLSRLQNGRMKIFLSLGHK